MGTQKLCACNRTCQTLVCAEIEHVDTVKQPFAVLVENLSRVEKAGLWLKPFRGIPRGPRISRFDVIYLDEDSQVLEFVESFTDAEFEPFPGEAASALILPPHTLNSFDIQKTDQLTICCDRKVLAPSADLAFQGECLGALQAVPNIEAGKSKGNSRSRKNAASPESFAGVALEEKPSLRLRLLRWLFQVPATAADRRRGERFPAADLAAYYWTGGSPTAYQLGNVSISGLYLLTEERWLPGTRIVMILQKGHVDETGSGDTVRVESEVVRWGEDGIGCQFVESGFVDLNTGEVMEQQRFDKEALARVLQSSQKSVSQAHRSIH